MTIQFVKCSLTFMWDSRRRRELIQVSELNNKTTIKHFLRCYSCQLGVLVNGTSKYILLRAFLGTGCYVEGGRVGVLDGRVSRG